MSREMAQTQRQQTCLQFMSKLHQMQQARHLCDLVLDLRNQKFYVHKVVVAAWSPAMYNLLCAGQNVMEIIRVKYDNAEIFGSFLFFLYSGEVDKVAENNLIQILHLATSLQVYDLRQVCEEALKKQVHIDNIISTYHVARKFRLPSLEEYTLNYMQMNLPEAVKQADFLSLSPTQFNAFLSNDRVCVMKSKVKFFLIISWLGNSVKERQKYLVLLIQHIDWSTVAKDFLSEISQTENFFTTNESSLYLLLQALFSSKIPLGPYTDRFPALKKKYAYLMKHIVQHSNMLPVEVEEYFPVSFQLASVLTETRLGISSDSQCSHYGNQSEISALGNGKYPHPSETNICVSLDTVAGEFLEHSSMPEVSKASVTTSIGLGFKKVSIMESKTMPAKMSEISKKAHRKSARGGNKKEASLSGANGSTSLLDSSLLSKPTNLSKVQSSSKKRLKRTLKPELKASLENTMNKALPTKRGKKTETATVEEPTSAKVKVKFSETATRKLVTLQSETVRGEQATASNITQRSERPRRRAAAKFSIPKHLIPCQRKTKAVLKTVVPEADGGVEEDEKSDLNEINGNHSTSDRDLSNETVKEKDSSPVQKETSSAKRKASKKTAITEKVLKGKSDDLKLSLNKTLNKFTHVKRTELKKRVRRRLFVCSVCQLECKGKEHFYEHMKEHFNGPPYLCNFEGCYWQAFQIHQLLNHHQSHMDERPHKCPHCAACFKAKFNLNAHLKCHSEVKEHECQECHRRFRKKSSLHEHLATHSNLRPYVCGRCDYSTKFKSNLVWHKRIHTGELFKCGVPECDFSTPKRNRLKVHVQHIHLNIREHTCHSCEKSFAKKCDLERHAMTHLDTKPHQCDQCEFKSTRLDSVKAHKRKYHSQDASNRIRPYKYIPRSKKGEQKKKAEKSKLAVAFPKLKSRHSLHVALGNVEGQERAQIEVISLGGEVWIKAESADKPSVSEVSDQVGNLRTADSGRTENVVISDQIINETPDQLQDHGNELGKSLNPDQRTQKEATDQSGNLIPSSSVSQQHKNLLSSTAHPSAALLQQLAKTASSAGISQ